MQSLKDEILRATREAPMNGSTLGARLLATDGGAYEELRQQYGSLSRFISLELPDQVAVHFLNGARHFSAPDYQPPRSRDGTAQEPATVPYRALLSPGLRMVVDVPRTGAHISARLAAVTAAPGTAASLVPLSRERLREIATEFIDSIRDAAVKAEATQHVKAESWWDLLRLFMKHGLSKRYSELRKAALAKHVRDTLQTGFTRDHIEQVIRAIEASSKPRRRKDQASPEHGPQQRQPADLRILFSYAAESMSEQDLREFLLPLCAILLSEQPRS